MIHDDLLPGQHARLHARFAKILEEHPELMSAEAAPLEIAHHWNAAHEVNKAFRWALTAASQGLRPFQRRSSCTSGPWSCGRWTIHNRSLGRTRAC